VINKLVATKLIHWKIDPSIVDVGEEGERRAGFSILVLSFLNTVKYAKGYAIAFRISYSDEI
jgi:hypothetical protein